MLLNIIKSGSVSEIMVCIFSSLVVILLTMPVHEWAHGFVSSKLGDPTPRYHGRLTLNPMAHIDPIGAIGILLFGIGWAKPVSVNARYYKNPKWGMALVAAAGPISNIIVALISLLFSNLSLFIGDATGSLRVVGDLIYGEPNDIYFLVSTFFQFIALINISLAVFNLIPIPPFDGSRILFTFLPSKYYFKIMQYEQYIFIGLLVILYSGIFDLPLAIARDNVFDALNSVASLPFELIG